MARELNKAQVNHLRRLLGWLRCEVGQTPAEWIATVTMLSERLDGLELDDAAKTRLVEWHRRLDSVPLYVRAAIKSLELVVKELNGEIVDGENVSNRRLAAPEKRNKT